MGVLKVIAATGFAVAAVFGTGVVAPRVQQGVAQPAGPLVNGVSAYGGKLTVPAGLKVTAFAKLPGARFMAQGPDGSVYVSETGNGRVVRLVDADHNGVAHTGHRLTHKLG